MIILILFQATTGQLNPIFLTKPLTLNLKVKWFRTSKIPMLPKKGQKYYKPVPKKLDAGFVYYCQYLDNYIIKPRTPRHYFETNLGPVIIEVCWVLAWQNSLRKLALETDHRWRHRLGQKEAFTSSKARCGWGNPFHSFLAFALVPSASTSSVSRRPDAPKPTPTVLEPEQDLMQFDWCCSF